MSLLKFSASSRSAHGQSLAEGVNEELTCAICLSRYNEPKILPCLHIYCKTCLEDFVKKSRDEKNVTCPQCKVSHVLPSGGIDGFSTLFTINNLLHIHETSEGNIETKAESIKCTSGLDEGPEANVAVARCLTCADYLCESCYRIHLKQKITRNHNIKILTEIQQSVKTTVVKSTNSPCELSYLKEQTADTVKFREKRCRIRNSHLASDLLEAKDILQKHETTNHRLHDRIQMLEQLNQTLKEEKKTLLGQVNKLLEQNQSKDQEWICKEEGFVNITHDHLGELERDKARLTEQLVAQQREHLAKEIDFYKKSKSKNLLKKGFRKLKGKIQGHSHVFEMGDGTSIGSSGSSHTLSAGSPGSGTSFPALGMPPYGYDGSMSSSQSISPSSSMEADNRPDNLMSLEDFLAEANKTPNRRKAIAIDDGSMSSSQSISPSSSMEADNRPDNLMSLEDFLAEANKTPTRRKLHRDSPIQSTPPSTPRNSMLLVPTHTSGEMFNLQEFLSRLEPEESRNSMEEAESSRTLWCNLM